MRLGHKYPKKKEHVRAFVLSADVFPPNLVMHAKTTGLSEPIKADAERLKRVIDFIITKRQKDDVILLFDGRSKTCRKVLEAFEEKLSASNAHSVNECWIVFEMPSKTQDPRMLAKQMSFAHNNREVAIVSMPAKKG